MTVAKIREHYNARPFQPFVIHLADGRNVTVSHPEWMLISPSGRTITVEERDETTHVVDLLLVTSLETKRNGRRRTTQ